MLPLDDLDETRKLVKSRRSFESVPIRLRLTDEEIARFAVHRFEFPGVDIATRLTRFYPHGEHAVHALGYVAAISETDVKRLEKEKQLAKYAGTSLIGKLGIEASYEKELHGINGSRQILVNAAGRSVQRAGRRSTPDLQGQSIPLPGRDLITSIDLPTQLVAEQGLIGRRGAVVAIDPNTGDVIALVSTAGLRPESVRPRPHAPPNTRALRDNIDMPLLNRAMRGKYPPGSTVKPAIALGGLTLGVTTPQRTKFCPGYFYLPGSSHRFRDWRPHGHGVVAMETAISQSCDVYFYDLAIEMGVDKLSGWLAHFGFGKPTGIDISGERKGILPSPEWKKARFKNPADQVWFPGETVNFGIGQGYLIVTPMQIAHMASILALARQELTSRAWSPPTASRAPARSRRSLPNYSRPSKRTPEQVESRHGRHGQGHEWRHGRAASAGAEYQIAGKTGTAQVFTVGAERELQAMEAKLSERLRDHAWFIAFAPADAPQDRGGGARGERRLRHDAAAPIARRVLDQYLLGKTTTARRSAVHVRPRQRQRAAADAPGDE